MRDWVFRCFPLCFPFLEFKRPFDFVRLSRGYAYIERSLDILETFQSEGPVLAWAFRREAGRIKAGGGSKRSTHFRSRAEGVVRLRLSPSWRKYSNLLLGEDQSRTVRNQNSI